MPLRSPPHPAWAAALLVVAGVGAAPALPADPATLPVLSSAVTLLLLLLGLPAARPGRPAGAVLAAGLCLLLGAGKHLLDCERIPPLTPAGADATIVGVISDEPVRRNSRLLLLLDAAAAGDTAVVPWQSRVEVSLPHSGTATVPLRLSYGMTIAVRGTLERPPAQRNPGEFDSRRYKEANGISHMLSVPAWINVRVLSPPGGSWVMRRLVIPCRRAIRTVIDSSVGGEEGEFLKGLLIGERTGLSPTTREAFINAGVAHVLAVSGSNVAVVAAILGVALQVVRLRRMPRTLCVIGGLLFYMLLTGSQPPVVRATIMAVALLAGRLSRRRISALNSLGIAALLLMAIDTRALYDVGFQLSFAAVASIVLLYPRLSKPLDRLPRRSGVGRAAVGLLRAGTVSLAATVGTLPLTAVSFGRVSVVGLLVNLAVIPATGLSVMLGAASLGGALVSAGLARAYGILNRMLLHWILLLTHLAGFSAVAYIDTARFAAPETLTYLLVLGALCCRALRPLARLVTAALLCALYAVLAPAVSGTGRDEGRLRLSAIDVGQGDAILAEFPDGIVVLIDAGPRTDAVDAGRQVVVPFLRRRGIDTVHLLIVSHMHADHAGGVPAVAAELPVKQVLALSPHALLGGLGPLLPPGVALPCDSARPGEMPLRSACARVYLLSPRPGPAAVPDPAGNASLVLKLQYGEVSFLLTGDAGSGEEQALVSAFGTFLCSTVLKAAHHGSSTSTSLSFLEKVRPRFAVVSAGKYNAFRHPSPATLRRLTGCGAAVSRTDQEGAVVFETDGLSVQKLEWR